MCLNTDKREEGDDVLSVESSITLGVRLLRKSGGSQHMGREGLWEERKYFLRHQEKRQRGGCPAGKCMNV